MSNNNALNAADKIAQRFNHAVNLTVSDYTSLSSYFVDGNKVVFQYSKIDRVIKTLGYLIGGVKDVPSYNHHVTIGNKTYSFWSE